MPPAVETRSMSKDPNEATVSPLAGKPAPKEMLLDPARLERDYFERHPDLEDPGQLVRFGTSGHRGSPLAGSFNDPDSDRHGIVTPVAGLMNPNHYLAVAIRYLLTQRPRWRPGAAVGKTLVSSSMIDRVVKKLARDLREVPVGFKWFVPGLIGGSYCFGGEESAGASFLRFDGTVWTTDKDGPIMDLLAAEITARTDRDPGEHYRELTAEFGVPYYTRIDAPASSEQKARLEKLSPEAVKESTLAGEPILAKITRAPGNDAPIGGLKVVAKSGWFAARPSGTENITKSMPRVSTVRHTCRLL